MYKLLITILLFNSTIFAKNILTQYETKIIITDKNSALIKSHPAIKIGSSGVIIHNFDNTHKTISKGIIVIDKDEKFAKVKYFDFDYLKQEALPSYDIKPQTGDKVILNYLYNRVLAVTPNRKTFKYLQEKFNNFEFVHPDLLAMQLIDSGNKSPTKKDFQTLCKSSTFALILFAIEDRGHFVDCNSFKILKSTKIETFEDRIKPFYSRVDLKSVSILSFFTTDEMDSYDSYYKKFLGLKNGER